MSKTQEIGGRRFDFGVIPAEEAVEVEVAIAKVIGEPALRALMELDEDEKKSGKVSKEKMMAIAATAVGLLSSRMDAKELLATMKAVFKYASCDGERIDINKHFTGRNKDLWLAFVHALRFNFSDFFPDNLSAFLPENAKGLK